MRLNTNWDETSLKSPLAFPRVAIQREKWRSIKQETINEHLYSIPTVLWAANKTKTKTKTAVCKWPTAVKVASWRGNSPSLSEAREGILPLLGINEWSCGFHPNTKVCDANRHHWLLTRRCAQWHYCQPNIYFYHEKLKLNFPNGVKRSGVCHTPLHSVLLCKSTPLL